MSTINDKIKRHLTGCVSFAGSAHHDIPLIFHFLTLNKMRLNSNVLRFYSWHKTGVVLSEEYFR